jgi:hypothetical protein
MVCALASSAHSISPLNDALSRRVEVSPDHLMTTRRPSGLGVRGGSGDHAIEHRDGLATSVGKRWR